MTQTLKCELVTPEAMIFSGEVEMVEAPGVEGDFGVLPLHAPLMSLLREGEVTLHVNGAKTRYHVTGGTAEVNEQGCVILAEAAELAA